MPGSGASQDAITSINPHPTLLTLPKELLTNIALSLDLPSALSLATVCRALLEPAQHRIWSHLDLCVHKNHGEYPLIRTYGYHDHRYCGWAQSVALQAEKRHRTAVLDRINGVMMNSGTRRLCMVKSIKARPRAGANLALAQLLTAVAPSLTELEFQPPERHVFDHQWESSYTHSIFFAMLAFDKMDLIFPALTHVTIGPNLIVYRCTIDQLLNLAPNMRYLDIDLSSATQDSWKRVGNQARDGQGSTSIMQPEIPLPREESWKLVDIRIKGRNFGNSWPEVLKRICMFGACDHLELDRVYITKDGERVNLLDLFEAENWYGGISLRLPSVSCGLVSQNCDSDMSGVRVARLSVGKVLGVRHFEFITVPRGNSWLKHLRIENTAYTATEVATAAQVPLSSPHGAFIEVQPCKPISGYSVAGLQAARELERLEFVSQPVVEAADNWKVEPYPTTTWPELNITGSIIRSFKHGGEELLHVRTWSKFRRIAPDEPGYSGSHGSELHSIKRTDEGGQAGSSYRVRVREVEELEWEDATDYKGLVVPLDIIGMMRKVDGKTLDEWQGRGVQVGDKGWKVLTDWAARQPGGIKAALDGINPAPIQGSVVKVERADLAAPDAAGVGEGQGGGDGAQAQVGTGGGAGGQGDDGEDAVGDEDGEGEEDDEDEDDSEDGVDDVIDDDSELGSESGSDY